MQIEPNAVVSVTYKLNSNLPGADPVFVEEAGLDNPLMFLFGTGSMIPDFENNLNGKQSGEEFMFSIAAENAYGIFDENAIVRFPMDTFKVNGEVDYEILKLGNMLPLSDDEGNRMMAKVKSVETDSVLLDFNHPLAGHELHFSGSVISVRPATEDELAHGHVHPDGHHH